MVEVILRKNHAMEIYAVIPVRFASTRLPGKPLMNIAGKPMIQHVYERALRAPCIRRVIVATDDTRIHDMVSAFGGEAVMTSPHHKSGTDRIAEAIRDHDVDIVVNIQGDEPMIEPDMISEAVLPLMNDRTIAMGTLKSHILEESELNNPHIVKVVVDRNDFALYFSRSPIPYMRDGSKAGNGYHPYFKHVGIYVYQKDFLQKFSNMNETPLESAEKLEQLRALENGYRIFAPTTTYQSIGVDTYDDLEKVRRLMKE